MPEKYVPGALTSFLSGSGTNDSSVPKKGKKRKKGTSMEQSSDAQSQQLPSYAEVPELPTGVTVMKSIKKETDQEVISEESAVKVASREEQRLNRRKRKKITKNEKSVKKEEVDTKEDVMQEQDVAMEEPEDSAKGENETAKEENGKKEKMTDEEKERTVFVGNVPITASRKTIQKLFSEFGNIESVRLRSVVSGNEKTSKKVAVLKNDFSSKMNSLHFYVKFRESASAEAALIKNGEMLDDHRLRVDGCKGKKIYDSKTTVFVGNVPFTATEDSIHKHFEQCGEVSFVRLVRDPLTGAGKGFAFVAFKDPATVPMALKMDGSDLEKRQLRVSRVQKKNKRKVGNEWTKQRVKGKRPAVLERKMKALMTNNSKKRASSERKPLKKAVKKKIKKRHGKTGAKSMMS